MDGKIRVLVFSIVEAKGGVSQFSLNWFKYIDKTRFCVGFLTFSPRISYEQEIVGNGGRVIYLRNNPQKSKLLFIEEFSEILQQGWDVLHINTSFWKDTIIEEIARTYKVPKIIVHAHSTGLGNTTPKQVESILIKHYEIRESLTPQFATDYWACSEEAAEWLFGKQIPKSRIKIIKNAIDTQKYQYSELVRLQMRQEYAIEKECVVGFVGRLEQPKNFEFIMELANSLVKEKKEIKFVIVGEGSKRAYIEKKINEYDIGDRFFLAGFQANVQEWMQMIDIFILPSLFEGFPLVALEAQTAGLKCLVSPNMSKNVCITQNIEMLNLEIETWKSKILEWAEGYVRHSQHLEIKRTGYDIKDLVRTLEEEYMKNV